MMYRTYQQVFANFRGEDKMNVRNILQWLRFSARPLQLKELAEIVTIDLSQKPPQIDFKRRFSDPGDVLAVCSPLIRVKPWVTHKPKENNEVELSHFSVEQFLLSKGIQLFFQPIIQEKISHAHIAKSCLTYLLQQSEDASIPYAQYMEKYPLSRYAAEYWPYHYKAINNVANQSLLDDLVYELVRGDRKHFLNWLWLFDPDRNSLNTIHSRNPSDPDTLKEKDPDISKEKDPDISKKKDPDTLKEKVKHLYPSPLYYMSLLGLEGIVQRLLDHGADVNEIVGVCGNPLQAASFKGHEEVVRLLLAKGADVNAQNESGETALLSASSEIHEAVVRVLLDNGANVNFQGGRYGNALQAASTQGYEAVVQLLLENGADVDAQGGYHSYALHAASIMGHEAVVRRLLENGADVNSQNRLTESALLLTPRCQRSCGASTP